MQEGKFNNNSSVIQAQVIQKFDSTIHRRNR